MVRMTGAAGRRTDRGASGARAADVGRDMGHTHTLEELKSCIDACRRCHEACEIVAHHCLHMGGAHAEAHHIRMMMDCAQICQTSADFMLRQSDMHAYTCGACAAICERCAEDCERFAGDKMMDECAEECRRCAEECRHMGAMTTTGTAAGTAAGRGGGARVTVGGRRRG